MSRGDQDTDTHTEERPYEGRERRQSSIRQGERSPTDTFILGFQSPYYEKINLCLSHTVYDTLLWQPQEINTIVMPRNIWSYQMLKEARKDVLLESSEGVQFILNFGLQNCVRIKVSVVLSHQVYHNLLMQPQETNTIFLLPRKIKWFLSDCVYYFEA